MKRFLTYCLLAATLIAGVAALAGYSPKAGTQQGIVKAQLPASQETIAQSAGQDIAIGMRDEHFHVSSLIRVVPLRISPFISDLWRTGYQTKLTERQLLAVEASFRHQWSLRQSGGFYLYQLCKMLI